MIECFSNEEIVARTLYGEARGEIAKVGIVGIEAVASVIWNRWKQNPKRYGVSVREVCLKPYQFSCWNLRDPNYAILCGKELEATPEYISCVRIAFKWLCSLGKDLTGGSNHYYAKWLEPPNWAKECHFITEVGVHRFYRL